MSPAEMPRPRAHSAAVMRLRPLGWTSLILIRSLPARDDELSFRRNNSDQVFPAYF
jgi:hypothetical protein